MRNAETLRQAVDHARRRHATLAADRLLGQGRLGDAELTNLLLVAYPTVAGQKN